MKTSVLASMLLGSLALAAPLNKRVLLTHTNIVTETVIVYTTVWDGQQPVAAEPTGGAFFEKPNNQAEKPSPVSVSSTVVSTPPAAKTPDAAPKPSSTSTPPAPSSAAPKKEPSSVAPVSSAPAVQSSAPAPAPVVPSSTAAAPSSSAAAPSASPSSGSSSGGSGQTYSGGSITMNYYKGGTGACGDSISDDGDGVALGVAIFGDSIPDKMTGKNMNPWCNKKIAITYNGVTETATIKDRCLGCTGAGLDLTPGLWKKVTGGIGGDAGDRLEGATWKVTG